MRQVITFVFLIVYLLAINYWINTFFQSTDDAERRLRFFYALLLGIIFFIVDNKIGIANHWHEVANFIFSACLIFHVSLIIVILKGLITPSWQSWFYTFNGTVLSFAILSLILHRRIAR